MTLEAVPDNTIAVAPGLFRVEEGRQGHLLGGHCAECARIHFPATSRCPYCCAEGCETGPLSGRGRLYLYTVVRNRPPGYRGEVPFGFGVVELPEGLRVVTQLTESKVENLHADMEMRLVLIPLHVDDEGRQVVGYAFEPAVD